MGPGFKYHVVTIAAIFLALAVGLVVGSLTFSPYITRYYDRTLRSLQVTLKQDLNEKSQQVDRLKKGLDATLPLALSGKLSGMSIAILRTGDYTDDVEGIREALTLAGAKTISVTTVEKGFSSPDPLLQRMLSPLRAENPKAPADRAGLVQFLASALILGADPNDGILASLERAELISTDGDGDYQSPAHAVILLGGSHGDNSSRLPAVDQPLVNALQKLGAMVIMCEPERAAVSDVPGYQSLEIKVATVDDIDSDLGKLAMVGALLGARDDFGVKPTAHELLSPLK